MASFPALCFTQKWDTIRSQVTWDKRMRILDLGCGTGKPLTYWNINPADEVVGVDIDRASVEAAANKYPARRFHVSSGEKMPFDADRFDRVICAYSLPYMNIPKALNEINRVLVPAGTLSLSLHPPRFTLLELRQAFPRPVATLYRLYVLMTGVLFHLTGWAPVESFQTKRGMRIALRRAGFDVTEMRWERGKAGQQRFVVEATKENLMGHLLAGAA
jgi:ubiquinone/menaquinone biosynthesis C-methylase UbiE